MFNRLLANWFIGSSAKVLAAAIFSLGSHAYDQKVEDV